MRVGRRKTVSLGSLHTAIEEAKPVDALPPAVSPCLLPDGLCGRGVTPSASSPCVRLRRTGWGCSR